MPASQPEWNAGNQLKSMGGNRPASHPAPAEWRCALFEQLLTGIIVSSPETGAILAANPEACRLLGYTEAQLRSLQTVDLIADTDDAPFPAWPEIRSASDEYRGDVAFRRADGALIPVELNRSLFVATDGSRAYINGFTDAGRRRAAAAPLRQSEAHDSEFAMDHGERNCMNRALREREQGLRAAIEVAALGVWSWDRSADNLTWDERMCAIHGVLPDTKPTIATWLQLMHPDDRTTVVATTQKVMENDRQVNVEYRVVHPGGAIHHVLCSGGAIKDAKGVITQQLGVCLDVTENRRLEEALRDSEARLKAIIENTGDMIWSVDQAYRLLVANAACVDSTLRAHGRPPVIGESIMDATGVFAAGELWLPYYDGAMEGVPTRFEFESPIDPGATLECSLDPIRDERGHVTGVAGRISDISERLNAEAHLRETVQRLRLAADAAGIGVWNWNFADNTLVWDERMCELYGVPKTIRDSAIYYDVWRSRLHPDDLNYAETTLNDAVRTGSPWKILFRIVLPNGSIRHIQTSSVIDYDRKGAPQRMIGVNRDVTEQMNFEQFLQDANSKLEQRVYERTIELRNLVVELERANAGKDAFLAAVSHELRTPLTGVLAMAESLQEEVRGPLNEHQKRYVAAITESGARLLRIVNSVLRYVAAMSTDALPPVELCRMAELCAVSVRNAKAKAGAKQQVIQMDVEPFNLEVRSNGDFIIQLIDVFLDNAVKFTAQQGQLGVRVIDVAEKDAIQITVWDTGIGIGEDQRVYLFQPFTQADQRLARAYEGIGLGLALAKRIVDLLGGSIDVKSEVGKGSRFMVTLPMNMPAR